MQSSKSDISFKCKSCGGYNNRDLNNNNNKNIKNNNNDNNYTNYSVNNNKKADLTISNDYKQMLIDFTVSYLEDKPCNMYEYAFEYFKYINNLKMNSNSSACRLSSQTLNSNFVNDFSSKTTDLVCEVPDCCADITDNNLPYIQTTLGIDFNSNSSCFDSCMNHIESNFDLEFNKTTTTTTTTSTSNHKCQNHNHYFSNNNSPKQRTQLIIVKGCSDDSIKDGDQDDDDFELSAKLHLTNLTKNTSDCKKKVFAQSRRCSIFSKSYDPENVSHNSIDLASTINDIETIKNQHYENQSTINSEIKSNPEQRQYIRETLRSIILFKHLMDEDIEYIIDSMFERKCSKNETIIREGDNGNYLYIILKGVFDVYVKDKNEPHSIETTLNQETSNQDNFYKFGNKVGEYRNAGFFGELALLYNQPRSATVISKENDGLLFCMNRDKFQKLVISFSFNRRKKYIEFLDSMPLLKDTMTDYERSQVADALKTIIFKSGDCIFKQNDSANGMYFIETGNVEIVQEGDDEKLRKVLNNLNVGEFFGEMALVNKSPRSASAYAITNENNKICKLAFLDLDAFERLMGPCIELLKRKIVSYAN